jgi:hypothetical protein
MFDRTSPPCLAIPSDLGVVPEASLLERLEALADPRAARGVRHKLASILIVVRRQRTWRFARRRHRSSGCAPRSSGCCGNRRDRS